MAETYPFPSGVHVTSAVTLKLNDRNYLMWKTQFESLLSSHKLLGFINGRYARPSETIEDHTTVPVTITPNTKYDDWYCTDQLVRSWILGTLSEEVLGCVFNLRSSFDIWNALAENFNTSSVSRVFELRTSLQSLTKSGKPFLDYCREFRNLCDQLSAIGQPMEESMKIFTLLNGLDKDYDPMVPVIQNSLGRHPPPSLNDVISEIAGFDKRLQSRENKSSITPHMAFPAEQNNSSRYTPPFHNRGRGGYHRYGNNRGGRGTYSSRGRGFHQQVTQSTGSSSTNYQRQICQICSKPGHCALKCYNRFNNAYHSDDMPEALAALHIGDSSGQEWFPDSGASAHIVNSPSKLQASQDYNGPESVMVGNGNFLPITHVGSTVISSNTGNIPLQNVLVCPDIKKSLLSVPKLCEDFPCGVFFDAQKVSILDLESRKVLTSGPRRNGLYVLENEDYLAFYSNRQQSTNDSIWHHRLGHSSFSVLQHLHNTKAITMTKNNSSVVCEHCQMGKSLKLPFTDSSFIAHEPLDLIHCDLWGPSPIPSVQGFRYYVVFVDHFSRYSWFYPLHLKSDFVSIFLQFQKLVENQFNKRIKSFQSDGGGEFINNRFSNHLTNCGIKHRISCPYTPEQNGLAERKHRHLTELSLSMLFHSQVPLKYWVEAYFTANYIINVLPLESNRATTPYATLFHQSPNYTAFRVFGSACFPCLRPYASHKFEPRSLKCVFLGYNANYKGYRCLYPPTGRVYISRHVIFDENIFPFSDAYQHLTPKYSTPLLQSWQASMKDLISTVPSASSNDIILLPPTTLPSEPPTVSGSIGSTGSIISPSSSTLSVPLTNNIDNSVTSSTSVLSESQILTNVVDSSNISDAPINNHPMITRAKLGIHKPNPRYALLASKILPTEPKSIAAALKHDGWTKAMEEELLTMEQTKTYSLVPYDTSMNVLGSKWIFKTKLKADGTLNRLKARLVAKGYDQEEGIDFLETYSPVVRSATIRIVLAVAVSKQWTLSQLDVKNAFLHGDLHEDVFMQQPAGFEDAKNPSYVCKLHKAIYGLKQAPRAWFDRFSNFLLEFGFLCSKADPSLFVYHHDNKTLLLLLYVDDIILTGNDSSFQKGFLNTLKSEFMMTDLGPLHYFLGIQVQSQSDGLFLNQSRYAEDVLHQASMANCNPMVTPLPLNLEATTPASEFFSDPSYYRSLAGKLQYLTLTRPDIQFAVNYVCQRMHQPTVYDFTLLKHILRYIKGTLSLGIQLKHSSDLSLIAYSDSDWAGCKDTRRSTTGFCTFLGTCLVSWSAKRQRSVSRSSTEAEYRALADTAAELAWISSVLRDLCIPQPNPAILHCDNLSAVHLTANPTFHNRSKHIDTDYHYIRERVAIGAVETRHVPATLQLADVFTKSLPRSAFQVLRHKLGVRLAPTISLRGAIGQAEKRVLTNSLTNNRFSLLQDQEE